MIRVRNSAVDTSTPKLSITVPTPLYGGSLPIAYHAADAFEKLGHQCQTIQFDHQYDTYKWLAQSVDSTEGKKLQGHFAELLADYSVEIALASKSDLVWYTAQTPVSVNGLRRLRSNGVKTAFWFVEDVRRFEYWKYFVAEFDVVFTIQQGAAAEAIKAAGARKVEYLPCAANPSVHYQRTLSKDERSRYGSEVSFVGAGYPNRVRLFNDIRIPNLKLWGNDWPKEWLSRIEEESRRVSPEETALIYNASTMNLNIHSAIGLNAIEHGDFVNPRTFEIAACGAFQIVDDQAPLGELFTDGELAIVRSEAELKKALAYYLTHSDKRLQMCEAAQARVLREHTYAHRMRCALDQVFAIPMKPKVISRQPTIADLKTAAWGNSDMQAFLSQFNDTEPASLVKLCEKVGGHGGSLSRAELTILLMREFRNWGVEKGVIQ